MRNYYLDRKENLLDPEEVLLDKKAQQTEGDYPLESLAWPLKKRALLIVFWLAIIFGFLIFIRSFYLMILKGADYEIRAFKNKTREILIEAPRGIIYDRNKNPLTINIPSYSLMIIPIDLNKEDKNFKDLLLKISKIFNYDLKELEDIIELIYKKKLNYSLDPILLKSDLSIEEIRLFETEVGENKGFAIFPTYKREYPYKEIFAHVVGYVGKITSEELEKYKDYPLSLKVGKIGLESYYQDILMGVPGKRVVELDASLKIKKVIQEIEPSSGSHLITTLDKDLQEVFYNALKKSITTYSAKGAAGIILNPKNGEVLSLVSLESFDPNVLTEGKNKSLINQYLTSPLAPLFNRVVSGIYQPGSLIKPLLALAALEEGIIDPNKNIYDEGEITITNPYNPEVKYIFRDWKNHGWVNMKKAIAESCNFYFWIIGGGYKEIQGLGWEKIHQYFKKFGLGETTGIDLPSEAQGILPTPEYLKKVRPNDPVWRLGDTYNISIGTGGLNLTPLQMSAYISIIANNGVLMKPHLLRAIEKSNGEVIPILPEEKNRLLVFSDHLKIVQEGMREVILSGTATPLKYTLLEVAGKSGSPKYGQGVTERYNAVFGAYAPFENPEIVILIVIENPTSNTGSTLPVIEEVVNWYALNRYQKNF